MNKEQIIAAIILATGKKVAPLSKEKGYTKAIFYRVINGEVKKSPIRQMISDIIDRPINEIWPESAEEGK
ncbi:MAG: hypothetical protein COA36_17630 [Desulfotalea sp.]|nr:MAG: hypothetical protein COA36_17630 [Desulfotalea sp.]